MSYDYYVDKRRSDNSSISTARKEGLLEGEARGIEKGELKAKLEIAKKLKAQGLNETVIYDITGVPKGSILRDSSKPRWNVKKRAKK